MAKTDFKSVDEYIATQPEGTRPALSQVRAIVHAAVPDTEDVISYQIAAFKFSGKPALYLGGWKEHISIYPVTPAMVEELGDELIPHIFSKGTLRFSLDEPLPVKLIERIAQVREKEVAELLKTKSTTNKRASAAKAVRKTAKKKSAAKKPTPKKAATKKAAKKKVKKATKKK